MNHETGPHKTPNLVLEFGHPSATHVKNKYFLLSFSVDVMCLYGRSASYLLVPQ
jgi:hypothetical protein